jgi:CheY-like chemotaxis protein
MSSSGAPQHHRVVIVEDNVTTNNLLREWLAPLFHVTSFLDAESTIKKLPASPEPVVFIVDYNLPGMNGIDLRAAVASSFPKGKYILISGLFDEKLQNEARTGGYDVTLPKPFAMPAVLKKIQELLGIEDSGNLVEAVKQAKQQG